jgi:hypothetical protein
MFIMLRAARLEAKWQGGLDMIPVPGRHRARPPCPNIRQTVGFERKNQAIVGSSRSICTFCTLKDDDFANMIATPLLCLPDCANSSRAD